MLWREFLDQPLYLQFLSIRKLETVLSKNLDAIVLIWIVRGGNHDAQIKSMMSGQIGQSRSANHSDISSPLQFLRSSWNVCRVAVIHSPEARVSRPRITRGLIPFCLHSSTKAEPILTRVYSSRGASPATPRMPSVPKSFLMMQPDAFPIDWFHRVCGYRRFMGLQPGPARLYLGAIVHFHESLLVSSQPY